jgi:RNA polymerase-associated protein
MALIANRRSVMTLFSSASCPFSHRTRIVMAEKNITVDVVDIDGAGKPEDLLELNPYNTAPTLVDRDLVLYDSRVIMAYIDERFPHPPLMPVDPVSRAKARLALFHVDRDWYQLVPDLESRSEKLATKARKILRDSITASAEVFAARPFFLSEEFSMVDCCLAPMLWRLPHYGVELPPQAKAVQKYAERIFKRESFQASLSAKEREMRE